MTGDPFTARVYAADWPALTDEVNEYGCALLSQLLSPTEAAGLVSLYDEPEHFRATIDMQRYRFGRGEYRYFKAPVGVARHPGRVARRTGPCSSKH